MCQLLVSSFSFHDDGPNPRKHLALNQRLDLIPQKRHTCGSCCTWHLRYSAELLLRINIVAVFIPVAAPAASLSYTCAIIWTRIPLLKSSSTQFFFFFPSSISPSLSFLGLTHKPLPSNLLSHDRWLHSLIVDRALDRPQRHAYSGQIPKHTHTHTRTQLVQLTLYRGYSAAKTPQKPPNPVPPGQGINWTLPRLLSTMPLSDWEPFETKKGIGYINSMEWFRSKLTSVL